RPDHDPAASPSVAEPFVVIVAQGVRIPATSRLSAGGLRNVVVLDATGSMVGGPKVLRLNVTGDQVEFPSGDELVTANADTLSTAGAERLARALAPLRTSSTVDLAERPLESDLDLVTLLGIRDPRTFDVAATWRPRQQQAARLQVPLGVTEDGEVVQLDLKESAQGGMGPHGLLIGATGSGKSELLRTLVMGLVTTHSSEVLNLVLVDFKGGATFLNMDRLPHTSAVITNLADEIHLVDRMRDAINGEMIRRQELLRGSGHSSLFAYEKARASGADLAPLPSLLVIVDEFSELLASKPEFVDLFVSIGRLGRSLGVHLLLASQRLDESRIHKVEGHLSYRIALRTFSAMESRSVIGVSSAYELPSAPGNGFLKIDTTNLARFKAAYVSGPAPEPAAAGPGPALPDTPAAELTLFDLAQQGPLRSELAARALAEQSLHPARRQEPAGPAPA
ncbi:type VII secretion protein EccCa, partial [Streptomyces sp. NPDC005195]|uniref:type VII secretion protein EccCa n=1 Tax=Streptomyces sp. NPDC005195 TaxID=3154561 RepID=UPI0033BF5C33